MRLDFCPCAAGLSHSQTVRGLGIRLYRVEVKVLLVPHRLNGSRSVGLAGHDPTQYCQLVYAVLQHRTHQLSLHGREEERGALQL